MNHMLWPTALLATALFWLGTTAEQKLVGDPLRPLFVVLAALISLPGLLFAAYYTKLLGEPIWLYQFRAMPGTELTAAGFGLLAGFIHQARQKHTLLKRQLRAFTMPAIFAVVLTAPYIKPMLRPVDAQQFQEWWEDGVCIQSTPSSCGPASAATITRSLGQTIPEADLARESLTYAGGTENWYLVRALRQHGFKVEFQMVLPDAQEFPTSAIAGVRLAQGTGHFIALIGRDGTNYIVGDPLTGRLTASLSELQSEYKFTGFFLVIK